MPSTETERPTAAIATQGADKTVNEASEAMTQEDLDDVEGSVSRLDSGPESSVESNGPMEEDQEEVMTEEEALEADLREWAKAEGISYEEALWRYEWRDAFRPVLKGIRENYPKDFSWFRFSRDSRAAVIGFHGEVPPDVQVILDEFSEAHEVEFVVNTQAGFSETDLSETIPRVHYALSVLKGSQTLARVQTVKSSGRQWHYHLMPHPLAISLVSHRMPLSPVLIRAWPLVWNCGPVSVAPWDIPRRCES